MTRYVRYYALYAALGAHAAEHDLDDAASLRLLRRSEVVLAGVSRTHDDPETWPGMAHAVDEVRHSLDTDALRTEAAARIDGADHPYSPRRSGFWSQYLGPSTVLGTAVNEGGAPRPGRHTCPPEVADLFAPLLRDADADVLDGARLGALAPLAMQAPEHPEVPWMRGLFTATRDGRHNPEEWGPDDRRRRATFRMLGRAVELHGGDAVLGWEVCVRSAVAFGPETETDPVLRGIGNVLGWRGLLLRNYSVSAWRRLWAALVRSIGSQDGEADRALGELRAWLADPMPATSLRACLDELPDTMTGGHPAPAERQIMRDADRRAPLVNVKLLLVGGRRAGELSGEARTTFLGAQHDILNPLWVSRLIDDFADRPMRDLAVRLVDDMLAQARRVALAKTRPDANGRMKVFSRVHERGDRYYKTGDEGDGDIGTRLHQAGDFAQQLGLLARADDGTASLTPLGADLLEVGE
ncbi:hypothetical protein [Actinomadura madurae]|uniref:hypothetical protein n=1 Tax=Actinomadura madurae TaxID=1993 RepID=UPI0020D22EFB|nr:hypothetical protein [Actinomadura madurae]MCP9948333.1 hypothetical protein [Actinomadura madurae]MCP9965106.1 hypothetical protein [Actinomadura madurae]MCP9977598.1 hypothetical protein [Actinomadura madurae]MCQ0010908.1 hypothetical protein [Actinomadura madurae]MCQ0013786.1 hypothetical protein [Actinomadura madurae]